MPRGLERIPLAVGADFTSEPVRAEFPEQQGQPEIKLVSFEADQPPAPQVTAQSRSAGDVVADTAYGFAKGAGSLAKGIGWLAGSDMMQQAGQDAEDYWGEKQTAELKRQLDAVGQAEGVVGTVESLWQNPAAIGDYIATSLPMMIPGMGAGSIGARGIVAFAGNSARNAALRGGATQEAAMQAGRIAAEKAAEKAATHFAVGANMIGEGVVSGGVTGADVEKFMLEHGATPEQAKAEANKAATMAGVWTTAGAGIGAGMETRAMLGRLKDTGVRGLVKNVGKEALEEAIQNPGEDYAGYQAKVKVDPTQTFDPGKSATLGAVTGGVMGGGFHAAGRASEMMSGQKGQPGDATPASDIGAGPGGGGGMDGEFMPAERPALPNIAPGGSTYDQALDALPPGQAMLPRPALPSPEEGGPSERQVATAIGLLKHSPKASPELLSRLMRVDETMAGMLFNHWKGGQDGARPDGTNAQVSPQGGQAWGDFAAGGPGVAPSRPDAGAPALDSAAGIAEPGGRAGAPVGGSAPGIDAVTDLDVEAHAAATSPFNATASFAPRNDGSVAARGFTREEYRSAKKALGLTNVYTDEHGGAVFPAPAKGVTPAAHLKAIKKALGYAEVGNTRPQTHDTETLWGAIKSLGGISMDYLQDITGESSTRNLRGYPPGIFRHGGQTPDELARALANDYGFGINLEDARDNGGINQLTDLIHQQAGGSRVYSMARAEREHEAALSEEHRSEILRMAGEYGVATKDGVRNRPLEDIEAELIGAIEFEIGKAGEAFAGMHKAALASGFTEDELSLIEDAIADKYDGDMSRDKSVRMYREIASALQEKIDDREGSREEGENAGTAVPAPGSPREAGEDRPGLELASQTEAELAARDKAAKDAEAQRLKDEQATDDKRQADAERDTFSLTGSDRPADVMAAQGQGGLFDAPAAEKLENATAPEHVATGVDDRELGQIVKEFNAAQKAVIEDGDKVTHVFDPPAKSEIVRLNDKVKVYHKEHGWMTPAEAKAKIEEWKAHAASQRDNNATRSANSQRVVLSLFDLTGKWSQPWEDAGYQVYRFDIQNDPDVGDVNKFSSEFFGDWFGDFEGQDIYAILAACPCTDFAVSGARHFAAKDADGRTVASVKLVHQSLAAIEYFKPAVWAIENPVGRIEELGGLPPWRLSFDPFHLGDTYTKKTLLWGRFNADLPIAPVEPVEGSKMHSQYGGKSMATKNARSATPEGFSYGFFMANNAADHPAMAIANKYDRLDRGLIEKAVAAGVTERQISDAVDDLYYMDLDDKAANDAIRALLPNQEQRSAQPVAESQAPAPEAGDGEVATAQAGAAPDIRDSQTANDDSTALDAALNAGNNVSIKDTERKADADGNPIYKIGERVEYVSGQYAGRHGAISQVIPMVTTTLGLSRDAGYYAQNKKTDYYYHVRTDNGADFMASPGEIQRETAKPESVVPDIEIDGTPHEPESVLRSIGYAKSSADNSRAAAQRARKAEMIASHKRNAETQDKKAARYQAAWDAWAAKYPDEAEKLAPKPAVKQATNAGQVPAADAATAIKAAGLTVTKTTTKNGKPVWEVGGNTKEHYELLKRLGGRWYGPKKVWSFYNDDPSDALAKKLPAAGPTIAGTPAIQMTDRALEQIAASSQPAAEKAKAELDAREKADEVDLGQLFDEVLAEETAPKPVTPQAPTAAAAQQDPERFERAMRVLARPTRGAKDDIVTTGLRYVYFDAALALAREAVSQGVKPVPAQFHSRLDLTMESADRLIAELGFDREGRQRTAGQAPGTRTNGATEKAAADRLELLLEHIQGERDTPAGAARSGIRSVIEALRKERTAVSIKEVLETASDRLMRNNPAQAQVVDEVIESLDGAKPGVTRSQADLRKFGAEAFAAGEKRIPPSFFAPASAKEWLAGWDAANLAAPVERTAGEAAASAVKNTAAGLADAIDGLGKLFGSNGSKLSSGLTFDEDTYKKAKPLFAQAIAHFKDAGQDLKEAMRAVVRLVLDKFGPQVAENMKDYVVRFMEDVKAGNVVYDGGKESDNAQPENIPQRERAETGDDQADRVDGRARQPDRGSVGERVSEGDAQARGRGQVGSGDQGSAAAGTGGQGVRGEESVGRGDREPATAGDRPERTPAGLAGKTPKAPSTEGVSVSGKADFRITEEDEIGAGGQKTKARANIAAIRLLKKLEAEDRKATPAEQKILAKYVGWGGIKGVFDEAKSDWAKERQELKSALSDDEYAAARRSMLDAHYTSTDVVAGMWSAAQHLGFKGGRVLEPSVGVGNFFGMMPAEIRAKSQLFGVELDKITAMLARNLYPSATVANKGFQDVELPAGSFDFVIGNPPFGKQSLYDKSHPELRSFSIHNFFFAKALDKLRPGGILQMVVSHHLMDAIDSTARDHLAERADLIGAIRLPDSAFKANAGTDVVTDIIFLQKREEGAPRAGFDWSSTGNITTTHPKTGEKFDFHVNRYFIEHPEMVVGEHVPTGKMNMAPNQYNVEAKEGESLFEGVGRAIGALPRDVMTPATKPLAELASAEAIVPDGTKVYGYYMAGGQVMQRLPDALDKRQGQPVAFTDAMAPKRAEGMVGLRNALRDLMQSELSDAPASELDAKRSRLNRLYDSFQKQYGYINQPANRRAFRDDPDLPLLESLEPAFDPGLGAEAAKKQGKTARKPSAKKADIFSKRVLAPYHEVTSAASAKDALVASLNEHGEVNPEHMAEIYGKTWDEIRSELGDLIFHNPNGGWETADAYLSGNVKAKLKLAEDAAAADPQYQANVEALRAVIPADVPALKISVRLGSPWITPEVMAQFAESLWGDKNAAIRYVKQVAKWSVKADGGDSVARSSTWGVTYASLTGRSVTFGADQILEAVANNRSVVIKENLGDRDRPDWRTNEPATEAIRAKMQEMAAKFKEWLWQDEGRRDTLAKIYNERYNTDRRRSYDGSHLTLPGSSPLIKLRKHQLNAIWRAIQDRTILLDHVVGAGKTYEKVGIAMELRRLGAVRKPMFVVPNALVRQWRDEFYKLYPNANVLAATEADFAKANRKRFMAKIATGDWDAVIVAHSSFKKIGMPQETEWAILKEQLDDIADAIEDLKRDRGDRNVMRDMERIKIKLEERMKALRDSGGKKDNVVTFDELGVDGVLVDEAHLFKNLFYYSQMRNVTGLGNPTGSGRAFDLFVKLQYLAQRYAGKALTAFATGTPVSNSLVEMFTMQRYLSWNKLKENGLHLLDAWAGVYGDVQQVYEVHPSGTGYRLSTRFAKFVNLPSLMELYRSFADVVTMDDLKAQAKADGGRFPVPKVKGGRPRNIVAERSDLQSRFFGVPEFGREGDGIKFKYPADLMVKFSEKEGKWFPWLPGGSKVGGYEGFDTEAEATAERDTLVRLPEVGWNSGSILHKFENLRQLTKDSKGKINALSITNEARKAGLDYRLIDPAAPDFAGSKINLAIEEIKRIHKAWTKDRGAQLVFCDLSVPKSARSAAASKERDAYVRASDGSLVGVKATVVTIEGVDASFLAVKRGKGDSAAVDLFDGLTGAPLTIAQHTKAEAVADLKKRIDADGLGWLEDLQDRYGEITDADIADYKDALGKDDGEAEEGEEGAISVSELLALAGGNAFSVYDDIKAKLLKSGIPESEVAFIHDYDTAAKKNDLFKKVRAGEIRILLGSTEKMGAGMNVQERLVALHHLDAPWRPSDLEQREGRIVRQGNELYMRDPDGFEVEIMRYGTRQTYDTRMWQIIEHKAAGVEQLRKAGDDLLEIEDVGGEAANAADMKAAASGNPLILDEIKLRNEVKSLEAQQFAYIQAKANMQDKVRWYRAAPGRAQRYIEEIQPYLDAAKNNPAEPFAYTTENGKKITDKKDVATPITAAFAATAKAKSGDQTPAGSYRGVALKFRRVMDGVAVYGQIGDSKASNLTSYTMDDKFSPSGLFQRIDNTLERIAVSAKDETARAERELAQIPALESEIEKPFTKEEELKETRAKHRAVVSKLQKSGGGIELTPEMKAELDAAIAARTGGKRGMESRKGARPSVSLIEGDLRNPGGYEINGVRYTGEDAEGLVDEAREMAVATGKRVEDVLAQIVPDGQIGGMESRAAPADLQFAASVLYELTEQDEAFRYPASKSADLKAVFAEVYPGAKFLGEHTREDERDETQADHRYVFLNHLGKTFYVYRTDAGRAWLDVSKLNNGDGGNQIYAAVANWAYNARLKFQGDPVGVSPDATIRRTTNMLSSALRFGTTRHLDASHEQIKGDPENGVEPLKWGANDVENLRELIHTFLETLYNKFPKLDDYRYDFAKQGFFDRHGNPVGRERFDAGARTSFGRDARAGEATLRRGVFLKSLVSSASGERPAILEQVLNRARALVAGGLQGFLSKTTPAKAGVSVSGGSDSVSEIRSVIDKFKAQFKGAAALDIRVVENAAEIPARFRPSPYAEGVFHDDIGLIYLVASNLRSANGGTDTSRAFQVLMHEAVGHYGLAQMMGERFKPILDKVMAAAKAKGEVGADTYQPGDADYATVEAVRLRYPEETDEEVAQEVLARMAETDPGRTLFGYVRAAVRQWLRDMARAMGLELDVTTAELNDLVALASAYMRRGENLGSDAVPSGMAAASKRGGMESRAGAATQRAPKESSRGILDTILRKAGGELAAKITGPAYDKLGAFIGGKVPEGIKAGVISDFGLEESYTDRRTQMQTNVQKGARQTKSFIEGMADLDRAQSRVAYQWLNNRGEEADRLMAQLPPESRKVLEDIKKQIAKLTVEAVRLGQIDAETAARNFMAYLHRSYAKYDLNTDDKTWKAERAKAIKILGDQYKGRGLKMEVDPDRIHAAKGWWDGEMKGKKVRVFKSEAGRYAFVAVGTATPPELATYKLEGTWEIRSAKTPSRLVLWRDFTAEERQMMGELDEAKYAVARTLFMMQRDIEVGHFHEWVADEYAKTPEEAEEEGLAMAEASESLMRSFRTDEWVTVPTGKIPGTGVFKFGALAGMVVPGPVWNDIRQINHGRYEPLGSAYASILRAWKLSKTALTPTTHVNNIMGNFVMADMHDVGARDISQAVRLMLAASKGDKDAKVLWERFEDSGATQGMFTTHELKSEVLDPLMKALREEVGMADDEPAILKVSAIMSLVLHGKLADAYAGAKATIKQTAAARGVGAVVSKAQDYYQNEDAVFRFAAFLKAIGDGKTDLEAGKGARKAFLDYHINAPWINVMRGTGWPFVSFAYRAIPMLLDTAAKKPWKTAKYLLVAGGLNALAYAMLGADGDEDKERAFLPDEKSGRLWGVVPKLIRMPWNREGTDRNGKKISDPVFLDVRRWVPVGDFVDYGQDKTALPLIPPPLIPGGPLVMVGEFVVNKSAFTGKDITNRDTDTWVEQAAKVGGHFYKGFAPNVPGLPGTWATDKIVSAAKGKTDALGRAYDLPSATLSGVGVKLAPYPTDTLKYNEAVGMRGKMGDLDRQARALRRDYSRGGLERVELEEDLTTIADKKRKLAEDFKEKEKKAGGR